MEQVKQAVLVDGRRTKKDRSRWVRKGGREGKGVYCRSGELSFAYYPYSQPY